MSLVRYCDKCKSEITGDSRNELKVIYKGTSDVIRFSNDLCENCVKELDNWIKGVETEASEEENTTEGDL